MTFGSAPVSSAARCWRSLGNGQLHQTVFSSQLKKGETVGEASAGVGGYAGMLRIEIELLSEQITQRHRFLGHDPFVATVRLGPAKGVDNSRFDRRTTFAEEFTLGLGYFRIAEPRR